MKTDTHKTKVQFLIDKNGYTNQEENEKGQVFAFFTDEMYSHDKNLRTCYSHIGQHSACHVDYAKESRPATPAEYADLKRELESIGYNLEII